LVLAAVGAQEALLQTGLPAPRVPALFLLLHLALFVSHLAQESSKAAAVSSTGFPLLLLAKTVGLISVCCRVDVRAFSLPQLCAAVMQLLVMGNDALIKGSAVGTTIFKRLLLTTVVSKLQLERVCCRAGDDAIASFVCIVYLIESYLGFPMVAFVRPNPSQQSKAQHGAPSRAGKSQFLLAIHTSQQELVRGQF
jgi:hypothetical protein